jgi:hypothetical protein
MGCTIGVLMFDCRRGLGIFLFTTASRTALGPTQPPIQWVPGALSLGIKQPGREADHSPPSSFFLKRHLVLRGPFAYPNGLFDLHIETFGRTPWTGDRPDTRPLPTQDNTTQKHADTHPCPMRSQCSSGRKQ